MTFAWGHIPKPVKRSVMSANEFVPESTLGLTRGVRNFGPFAVALTEHRLGFQSAPHVHERAGVNFVIDGAYAERLGRHRLVALRGSWLAKPAWQEHANDFRESGARCLLVEIAPGHEHSVREIMDLFDQPRHRETVVDIRELHVLAAALHSNNFSETCDLEERTFALLLHVARKVRLRAEHQPNAWLRRIREMIHETRTNALSLTALSSAVQRHPAHVSRAFQLRYGCSIGTYLRRLRVERASALLRDSRLSISEVAQMVGFYDHPHLARDFRRVTGVTPSAYRLLRAAPSHGPRRRTPP